MVGPWWHPVVLFAALVLASAAPAPREAEPRTEPAPRAARRSLEPHAPATGGIFPTRLELDANRKAVAAALAARNREALRMLLAKLKTGAEATLCARRPAPPAGVPPPADDERRLRWLHFPKCGSAAATTFNRYGCPATRRPDLSLGAHMPSDLRPIFGVPDNSRLLVNTHTLATIAQASCTRDHRFDAPRGADVNLEGTLNRWAVHKPLSETADDATVFALFRAPAQRALSAFHFGRHVWGGEMSGGTQFVDWRIFATETSTALDFVALPGINGCYVKMLSGCPCATRPQYVDRAGVAEQYPHIAACISEWKTFDDAAAEKAARRVARLAFVGLQEAFNASVCLFHHNFGGDVDDAELALFNVGNHGSHKQARYTRYSGARPKSLTRDEAPLGDYVDSLDEVVWSAVLARFEADVDGAVAQIRAQ
mmetsp:Transcript_29021/g.100194  ORF Transcript_29021/g.100194 Transcript_29021/m.100194 type:complete len:426 (-) Transcript_29021:253-1530(-)